MSVLYMLVCLIYRYKISILYSECHAQDVNYMHVYTMYKWFGGLVLQYNM